ncbi:MAG: hypothetical protein ACLTWE_08035 [Dysgonomonas mossii]|uniref:hypothetical protein n=1 Tax=Dysgonomonas mossii TaxID=163665 RepID=UPI003993BE75
MKTKGNKIDAFFELSNEAFESDNKEIYDELGVSKDVYLESKLKMIKKMKMKSIAQYNKAKNQSLLEKALEKMQKVISSTNENLKEELERLIHKRSPQFQFRNVQKLDVNDLKELLGDIDILEIIDELEKAEGND